MSGAGAHGAGTVGAGWRTRPNAPVTGTVLAPLEALPHDNGLERVFGDGPRAFRVVLFRVGEGVRAYVNECPHAGIPFHFAPEAFCVIDGDGATRDLLCPHHAALFRLDDGHCHDGPCRGDRLDPVEVRVEQGVVRVA